MQCEADNFDERIFVPLTDRVTVRLPVAGHVVGHIICTTRLCACVQVMFLAIVSAQHACVLVCGSCCWPYYLHNGLVCRSCCWPYNLHSTLVCLCAGHVVGHIICTTRLCACVQVMLLAILACVQVMLLAILSTQHPCVLVCRSCCWPY